MAGMTKPKILFVSRAIDRAHMQDMSELFEMSFIGPLEEIGRAEADIFWEGPWGGESEVPLDWLLYERCLEFRPDILFLIGWWMEPDDASRVNHVSLTGYYLIRKLLNIRIVWVMLDLGPQYFETADYFTMICDRTFTLDGYEWIQKQSAFPVKHFSINPTLSPSLFHADAHNPRNIDLAFIGGLDGYGGERRRSVAALRASGLDVVVPGGRSQSQERLDNVVYADGFKRARIVICWSKHISGKWFQTKARIFETTLAGAMLLCEECDPVNHWFQPNVDYVPFSSQKELVAKARYYVDHEEERLHIAARGNETALAKYNADVVWGQTLEQIYQSLYHEEEAIASLHQNASRHEVGVARFFARQLQDCHFQLDPTAAMQTVEELERAHHAWRGRLDWHGWWMRALRHKIVCLYSPLWGIFHRVARRTVLPLILEIDRL